LLQETKVGAAKRQISLHECWWSQNPDLKSTQEKPLENMSFPLFQEQPLQQIVLCYTVHSKVAWRSCPLTTKKLVTEKFRQHTQEILQLENW